jgi:hypothetical protein
LSSSCSHTSCFQKLGHCTCDISMCLPNSHGFAQVLIIEEAVVSIELRC